MTIKRKIYLLPVLMCLFLVVMLVLTVVASQKDLPRLDTLRQQVGPAIDSYRVWVGLLSEVQRQSSEAVQAGDVSALEAADTTRDLLLANVRAARSNPAFQKAELDALEKEVTEYAQAVRRSSERLLRREPGADRDAAAARDLYLALQQKLAAGEAAQLGAADAVFRTLIDNGNTSVVFAVVFLLGGMGGLMLVTSRVAKQVVTPLHALTSAAKTIAMTGDLSHPIEVASGDELGQLALAFSTLVTQLRDAHREIESAAQGLVSSASQIQAASVEQEAASQTQSSGVEEVNRTMQTLLESATHIAMSASGVSSNAERTKETSSAMARRITELSGMTSRMTDILEVIREIADRSDLLALNASIEGTRAGEAGRGFSLVAAEMRRLSERVSASVQDVKRLVTDVQSSGSSSAMVTEEARSLADNTAASAKQITLVTEEQRTATQLVSASMKEVAEVLVRTVSATSQTKRAAADLASQAERLTGLVRKFRGAQAS